MLRVRSIVGGVKNSQGISRALRSDTIHNGYQIGDYPANVPLVNRVVRNPYFYEDMQERRNFGEPLHEQDEILTSQMPYPYYEVNPKLAYGSMAALVGVLAGFAWFIKKFGPQQQRAVGILESKHKSPKLPESRMRID